MNVAWQIAIYHFKREVLKRSYILTLLGLPIFMTFIIGLDSLVASRENQLVNLGVMDPGGFIRIVELPDREPEFSLQFFDSRETALAALKAADSPLEAVYIFPPAYPANRDVEIFYIDYPPGRAQDYLADLLRYNLINGAPPDTVERVIEGRVLLIKATAVNREFPATNPTASLFIPLILAVVYLFTIFPISGIMLGALGEEKVNRTIEVIVTSVSSRVLMTGKVLAVSAIALLQATASILFIVLAIWIGGQGFDLPWLQDITIPWRDVWAIVMLSIPGFLFYGAALVMVGSLVNDAESLQQVGGLIFLPMFLPMYILPVLLEQPGSPVAILFSLLPFTSVQTIGIQSIFMQVPGARIAAAAGIGWLSAALMIWLAARAFQVGMLRYGQRIRMSELFRRNRPARRSGQ